MNIETIRRPNPDFITDRYKMSSEEFLKLSRAKKLEKQMVNIENKKMERFERDLNRWQKLE